MSDDGYDYEYDYTGLFESEDEAPEGLAEHVDSLAEHTSHSPVLVNANPDYDIEWDEWEYLTDEYYDAEHENAAARKEDALDTIQASRGKRKRGIEDQNAMPEKQKRRKTDSGKENVVQQQPLVVWRERSKRDRKSVPLMQAGDGKQVALLENWRDLMPEDDEVPGQPQSGDIEADTRDQDDLKGAKRRNSHKNSDTSKQSSKRRTEETKSDGRKGTKIQQTEHPPVVLKSGHRNEL